MNKTVNNNTTKLDEVLEQERKFRKQKRELFSTFTKETEEKKQKLKKDIAEYKSKLDLLEEESSKKDVGKGGQKESDPKVKQELSKVYEANKSKAFDFLYNNFS